MKDILISDVVCATNGKVDNNKLNSDDYITSITTNSKDVEKGSLFIAIRGGHRFVQEAIDNGAICCVVQEEIDVEDKGVALIYVDDTVEAMMNFATFYRSQFNIPAVAITGSNGKTSTKDLVASVLSKKYNVLKTEGNFNNEIGVPLTIFNLREKHDMLVIEMGMNHFGEIERLVKIVQPDIAIITNIGVAHIEHLGSKKGILKAKMEITKGLEQGGMLVLNDDDEMLKKVKDKEVGDFKVTRFSKNHDADYKIKKILSNGIDSTSFDVESDKGTSSYTLDYPGEFMVWNAINAIICGEYFDVEKDEIIEGIKNFTLSKSRLEKFTTNSGTTIINDAYNASPDSMRASISILDNIEDGYRKILVLGDMFELGSESNKMHKELGKYLIDKNIDEIIFVGDFMKHAFNIYSKKSQRNCYFLGNTDEIFEKLLELNVNDKDIALFKASNGMKFKNVVEEVKAKL